MTEIKKFETHLFICVKCGEKDMTNPQSKGQSLVRQLKEWVATEHPEWKGRVRVTGSGCLGQCDFGVASVCYPQAKWTVELKENEIEKLKQVLHSSLRQ